VVGLLLALWLPASAAWAQVIVPPNLAPGSKYRLVFVTGSWSYQNESGNGTTQALSGYIADYNVLVTKVANSNAKLKELGTTWTAIASTAAISAKANTATTGEGVPIYRLSGTADQGYGRVADNYADLWDGSIDVPINVTQDGLTLVLADGLTVWTGTDTSGNAAYPLGSGNVRYGDSKDPPDYDDDWISLGESKNSSIFRRLYAMSGELTVSSVPEPASLGLGLAVALAGTAWWTRRRLAGKVAVSAAGEGPFRYREAVTHRSPGSAQRHPGWNVRKQAQP